MAERYLVFARVESEDGTVGWGEAITQFPAVSRAVVRLVEGMRCRRDPMANVDIWRKVKAQSW